jgi:hypothetical protein
MTRTQPLLDRTGIKRVLKAGVEIAKVSAGALVHVVQQSTPAFAHQAMVGLYCSTSGYSNDFFSSIIRLARPPYPLPGCEGVLGRMDDANLATVVDDLKTRGYHVFSRRLPAELCDRLLAIALETKCRVRAMDAGTVPAEPMRYDRNKPVGIRYDFAEEDLIDDADVQRLMSDLSILTVAQAYLESAPILDIVAMWWHTAFSASADKAAAQFYHFDMDRLKWLKFFVYLTDVSTESGPHCFVAGSHRRGRTPRPLLKQGYTRLGDGEVRKHLPSEDFIEFTGPRGTIIAEDTRGLHKGKHVEQGDRLMFELEFTNSLFGGELTKHPFKVPPIAPLAALAEQFPRLYCLFAR